MLEKIIEAQKGDIRDRSFVKNERISIPAKLQRKNTREDLKDGVSVDDVDVVALLSAIDAKKKPPLTVSELLNVRGR